MMLLTIVMVSLVTVFESVQRTQAFTQERSQSLDDMRIAMDRMTKEIRQASSISSGSTESTLSMSTFVNGVSTSVLYRPGGGGTLVRVVGSSQAPILTNLNSTSIFQYAPDVAGVQVVTITLSVHPARRPATVLQLTSEIRLRNEGTT